MMLTNTPRSVSQPTPPRRRPPALLGLTLALFLMTGLIFALKAGPLALAAAAPEPDPVPQKWQLEIKPGHLRVVTVEVAGVGPRMFLYLPYTVINNSGQDLLFTPSIELANGEGEILRSGRDVPQAVTAEIVQSLQNPMVDDQVQVIGELRQGEEYGKQTVVIWPLSDSNPQKITIYFAGFSGETATITIPGTTSTAVLRKTLRLDYAAPGELVGQHSRPLELAGRSWIMR